MVPNPIRLFHITAIDNLDTICKSGSLVCKNYCDENGVVYNNIAHDGAQGSRAVRAVPNPPGGTIHDFVPFYFAPRSPMLYAINGGRVVDCDYEQEDILHFETTVNRVIELNEEIVFYDRNATYGYSEAATDISELPDKIAWNLITEQPRLDGFCKYFQDSYSISKYADRLERRMAEFLAKQRAPLECMTRIGVINQKKAEIVRAILEQNGVELPVEVMTDWYFLGQ